MAKQIEIGTTLSGQDAIDFIIYMRDPPYTERAYEMMINTIHEFGEKK